MSWPTRQPFILILSLCQPLPSLINGAFFFKQISTRKLLYKYTIVTIGVAHSLNSQLPFAKRRGSKKNKAGNSQNLLHLFVQRYISIRIFLCQLLKLLFANALVAQEGECLWWTGTGKLGKHTTWSPCCCFDISATASAMGKTTKSHQCVENTLGFQAPGIFLVFSLFLLLKNK